MARTMKWPPIPVDGRIPYVEGVEASIILVSNTLGDLQQNPFNSRDLSLGEVTFSPSPGAEGRIRATMRRLRTIVTVDSVKETTSDVDKEDGRREYLVVFTDRETRQQTEVPING